METYLERRLNYLLTNLEQGKILFSNEFLAEEEKNKLLNELESLKRMSNGRIDINSATRNVRSFARAIYEVDKFFESEKKVSLPIDDTITLNKVVEVQRNYFSILEEFFTASTGEHPNKFLKKGENFANGIRKRNAKKIATLMYHANQNFIPKIQQFHIDNIKILTNSHKVIGGLKCVFGGSSRVNQSTFDSYRKIALYSDTVFIPDPILPWVEVERIEERYNFVNLLQACYYLLKFKPLVDADLPFPAIIVFPSWEKTLEKTDSITQDGISSLIIRFFSHYLEESFEDEREIFSYVVGSDKERFQRNVINKRLFIPPGSTLPNSFYELYKEYVEFLKEERSDEFIKMILSRPPEIAVVNGIMERIGPQFHVQDNSNMLNAHPLFYLPAHYHYYKLCSDISQSDLGTFGVIDEKTLNVLNSINHPNMAWLGNIPIIDLINYRKDNLNSEFRKKINEHIEELRNLPIDNINLLATEIGQSIKSMLIDHDKEAKKISENYIKKHLVTAGMSILSLGINIYPFLIPLVGSIAAFAPLGKYIYDNLNNHFDKKPLKRSMLGILSEANKLN